MRYSIPLFVPLLVALFAPLASAQTKPHVRVVPKILTGCFGNVDCRANNSNADRTMQFWYRGDSLPRGYVMRGLSVRRGRQASQAFSSDWVFICDNSSVGFRTLSTKLADNLSKTATEVFRGTISFPARTGIKDPNDVGSFIKFSRPFTFLGPHFLYQMSQSNRNGGISYSDCLVMDQSPTFHSKAGTSCGGDLTASYSNGNYASLAQKCPPNSPVVFMLSTENVQLGQARFPIDLSALGMKGCSLGLVPQLVFAATTNAAGSVRLDLPFALPKDSLTISAQAVHLTKANAAGLATTNVANSVLGNAGLANFVQEQNNRVQGPYTVNVAMPTFVTQ